MSNIDDFLVFFRGSNPPIPYIFGVLCRAKKRKKYTSVFALKTEKTGFPTADLPSESTKTPYLLDFLPKNERKTPFTMVDKRGFLYGWGGRIRTDECQSQSLVPYRLATPQDLPTYQLYHKIGKSQPFFKKRIGLFVKMFFFFSPKPIDKFRNRGYNKQVN